MGRILTIADCFDAMTARRPYKQERSIDYAAGELKEQRHAVRSRTGAGVLVSY